MAVALGAGGRAREDVAEVGGGEVPGEAGVEACFEKVDDAGEICLAIGAIERGHGGSDSRGRGLAASHRWRLWETPRRTDSTGYSRPEERNRDTTRARR